MGIIAIPPEVEDDQELRWHRRKALEQEELRTLRLVLQYERLKFEETRRNFHFSQVAPKETCDACNQTDASPPRPIHDHCAVQTAPTCGKFVTSVSQTDPVKQKTAKTQSVPVTVPVPVASAVRKLRWETSDAVLVEADGLLRRELRRAVEKGERRERELAELRAELARKTEEVGRKENLGNFMNSVDAGSLELREAALAMAMERLREREREFEEFVVSEHSRLEGEKNRLGRKKDEVITREKKLLQSSMTAQQLV